MLQDSDLPDLFQSTDASSLRGQRRYLNSVRLIIGASIVAAAGGAVASSSGRVQWLGYIAAAAFLGAILATLYQEQARPAKAWYDGRAAAESAKSLAWQYSVGGGPFCLATCTDPEERLVSMLGDIVSKLRGLAIPEQAARGNGQITDPMRALRREPLEARREAYSLGRIEAQRRWYASQARTNAERGHRWLLVSLALQGCGVVAGFLMAAGTIGFDALGILAACATGVVAWVQAKDHATLADAYGVTAQELGLVAQRMQRGADELTWAALVDDAEQAISREHTLWLARRGSAQLPA